ncbi:hypothetical protein HXA35_05610 [Bacillus sp. A301a_S52]|nr:hypothetical protein [Bacillus sp. A301a_S52]
MFFIKIGECLNEFSTENLKEWLQDHCKGRFYTGSLCDDIGSKEKTIQEI